MQGEEDYRMSIEDKIMCLFIDSLHFIYLPSKSSVFQC